MQKIVEEQIRNISGTGFFDFGKAAYGTLEVELDGQFAENIELVIGEQAENGKIIHTSGWTTFMMERLKIKNGHHTYQFHIPEHLPAYDGFPHPPVPRECGGEIAPFRYVEINHYYGKAIVRRTAWFDEWDESASHFESSDENLNKVWDFCKYSIKATNVFGVYIDGERERQPYEADSYLTALSYYVISADYDIVRRTIDYLMENPTWPTEYIMLMPILAQDYLLYTGDVESVKKWYPLLKEKLLIPFTFEGVLIDMRRAHDTWSDEEIMAMTHLNKHHAHWMRDIVDWPAEERDHYDFGDITVPPEYRNMWFGPTMLGREISYPSFVPNAFQAAANDSYAFLAESLGYGEEAVFHRERAEKIREELRRTMHNTYWDKELFVDHPGSHHTACMTDVVSLWANVAEKESIPAIINRIAARGMRCSVYGAMYLLDDLFRYDLPGEALKLMADTTGYRSWAAMLNQGATITKEAWDDSKEGLDWNHSWGTAALHIIPRCLFGIKPTSPGFASFTVNPKLAFLEHAQIEHPTVKGTIRIEVRRTKDEEAEMVLEVPAGTVAEVTFGDTVMEAKKGIHLIKGRLPLE